MPSRLRWNHEEGSRPDWVLVGAPAPDGDGVVLYASKSLTYASLVSSATVMLGAGYRIAGAPVVNGHDLALSMRDVVVVYAPTYAEALSRLVDTDWTPPEGPHGTPLECPSSTTQLGV